MAYSSIRYQSKNTIPLQPANIHKQVQYYIKEGTLMYHNAGNGSYTCSMNNEWLRAETTVEVKPLGEGSQLIMVTRLSATNILMAIVLPFIKWYMRRKQQQDLDYIVNLVG